MNIEEVLYLPVKREGLSIGPDKFFANVVTGRLMAMR